MNKLPTAGGFTVLLVALLPFTATAHHRLPQMPPDAPASTEIRINGDRDPVVERCLRAAQQQAHALNETILKAVVTRSSRWGTIWRADLSAPLGNGEAPMLWRMVCSKRQVVLRPLDMFDPKQSIPPLQ